MRHCIHGEKPARPENLAGIETVVLDARDRADKRIIFPDWLAELPDLTAVEILNYYEESKADVQRFINESILTDRIKRIDINTLWDSLDLSRWNCLEELSVDGKCFGFSRIQGLQHLKRLQFRPFCPDDYLRSLFRELSGQDHIEMLELSFQPNRHEFEGQVLEAFRNDVIESALVFPGIRRLTLVTNSWDLLDILPKFTDVEQLDLSIIDHPRDGAPARIPDSILSLQNLKALTVRGECWGREPVRVIMPTNIHVWTSLELLDLSESAPAERQERTRIRNALEGCRVTFGKAFDEQHALRPNAAPAVDYQSDQFLQHVIRSEHVENDEDVVMGLIFRINENNESELSNVRKSVQGRLQAGEEARNIALSQLAQEEFAAEYSSWIHHYGGNCTGCSRCDNPPTYDDSYAAVTMRFA